MQDIFKKDRDFGIRCMGLEVQSPPITIQHLLYLLCGDERGSSGLDDSDNHKDTSTGALFVSILSFTLSYLLNYFPPSCFIRFTYISLTHFTHVSHFAHISHFALTSHTFHTLHSLHTHFTLSTHFFSFISYFTNI